MRWTLAVVLAFIALTGFFFRPTEAAPPSPPEENPITADEYAIYNVILPLDAAVNEVTMELREAPDDPLGRRLRTFSKGFPGYLETRKLKRRVVPENDPHPPESVYAVTHVVFDGDHALVGWRFFGHKYQGNFVRLTRAGNGWKVEKTYPMPRQ